MIGISKRCRKCHRYLLPEYFNLNRSKKDSLAKECAECDNIRRKNNLWKDRRANGQRISRHYTTSEHHKNIEQLRLPEDVMSRPENENDLAPVARRSVLD